MTSAVRLIEQWHAEWVATDEPHWGDHIAWNTADEIARRIDLESAPDPDSCLLGPEGTYCTLQLGHEGGCHLVVDEG